jgi:hypothetical protein
MKERRRERKEELRKYFICFPYNKITYMQPHQLVATKEKEKNIKIIIYL